MRRRSFSWRADPRPALAALVLLACCARPNAEIPKLVWRDLQVDDAATDAAHRFVNRERDVRVSFRWEVPEGKKFGDLGYVFERFIERGVYVDRLRAFQSFHGELSPSDLRGPVERAARDLLRDEGKTSPEKADLIVLVTDADLNVHEDFICGNQQFGTPAYAAFLQAEGKDLEGKPFRLDSPGSTCRIQDGDFDECLERSLRGAVQFLFEQLGADRPRPPDDLNLRR
ncbi:hypothetical protein [Polyangium sp. y55x31]|uniref:hypothetical protein n=1 Tax=Polyangium sp. y55x31 TaxID=3042688 RepID=UPI00248293CB|nr:hypothetical protein [Polyangium sp. y55x31]MDI1475300.1 hypothetical protein [Polyangium sp. y55x31]